MEDIIYILIGVLWLVFTFYTQQKKRKLKEASREKEEIPPSRNILEELFGEIENETLPPVSQPTPAPNFPRKYTFEDQYEARGIQSIEKSGKEYHNENKTTPFAQSGRMFTHIEVLDGIRSLNNENSVLREEFDLRKALIYQAILDPPYL